MAGRFLIRPPKLVYDRALTAGDQTLTTPTVFTTVPGTELQFAVAKDSVVEILIEGSWQASAAANIAADLLVDAARLGQDLGLKVIGVLAANVALDLPMSLHVYLDSLAEGTHTLALQVLASAGDATVRASTAATPLKITVLEHAAVYPPTL